MTKVAVVGARGRMGQYVCDAVAADPGLSLTAAVERPGHPELGQELAPGVALGSDPAAALDVAEVAIDFSAPASTLALVAAARSRGTPLVIATTGFSDADQREVEAAARSLAVVLAANFSLGITVLLDLVDRAARALPDADVEVLEMHHRRKVDAPSGTALALGRAAAHARGQSLEKVAVYHREGQTGERKPGTIGMQTLRGGDVVGDHTVFLVADGERLELTHRALSRANFAAGAVRAARWLVGREPGLYSMADVVGG